MIFLSSILSEQRTVSDIEVSSKKKLLETISSLYADELNLNKKTLFNSLFEREQLSSTGIGNGFALPHARIAGIDKAYGCLINLNTAIAFDAVDNKPIDLIFSIIVPEEATGEHLEILAAIAKMFSNEENCNNIRLAENTQKILQIIQHIEQADSL